MRTITDHKLNGLNDSLEIHVIDEPGPGGANHLYNISFAESKATTPPTQSVFFQKGPINEAGLNGISNEALISIVIDRLRGFQFLRKPDGSFDPNSRGQYACRENAVALTQLEDSLMWLQKRTRDRLARGIEGTSKV